MPRPLQQGVLTVNFGPHGTYVINKQAPNHQLWWSSPISGPKRFYFSATSHRWLNTRDNGDMLHMLQQELHDLLNVDVTFDFDS